MAESAPPREEEPFYSKVIEAAVRLGLVLLLLAWCFTIIRPFITPVVWGAILAVAVYPAYQWLAGRLGGREKLSATLVALLGLALVIVPAVLFAGSMVESAQQFARETDIEQIKAPPPPPGVEDWPLIGERVHAVWSQASHSIEPLLERYAPQLKQLGLRIVGAGVGAGMGIVQSLLAIIIAGVLLAGAAGGAAAATRISRRILGAEGERYVQMTSATVRSVAVGIVGVAIIQAGLIGIGMLVVGVPHAAVWTLLSLFLAVLQLPPAIIVLPVVIYMFSHLSTPVAIAFLIWELVASGSDTFLKPILLARGVDVPMLVIFLGAIGGFMASGFIGLFVGAVVLSVGYELGSSWLGIEEEVGEST
jgi:predicted PurR-regulated permease PerM